MYLWLLMVVGAFVDGSATHWEPCKGQCINNYKENDIVQESLTSACQKGCDLLTAAFISTSEQIPFQHEPKVKSTKQNRSTTLILHLFGNRPNAHLRLTNEVPNNLQTKIDSPISVTSNKSPSIADKDGNKQVDHMAKNELFKIDKQESSSKTTMEPTSQPVQDHPVEANRQTTTTNGPRGETKPTSHKERKENFETKIKNAKHAQKHSSTFKHNTGKKNDIKKNKDNKMSKNIYSIKNKHETTKNEHLNMKERLEQAKHTCRQECIVTYTKASEQEACVVGCNFQLTTLSLNDPEEDSEEEVEPQPKSLLGMFQHVIFNFAGRVGKLFRVGWSMVSSSHSQPITEKPQQVFGTEGVNRGQQMPFFFGFRQSSLQEQMEKRIEAIREEQNNAIKLINEEFFRNKGGDSFENSLIFTHHNTHSSLPRIFTIFKKETLLHHKDKILQPRLNKLDEDSRISKQGEEMIKLEDGYLNKGIVELSTKATDRQGDSKEQIHHQLDLLECISRKSGLPRWFIAITIFSSAIVVLWLCFSLTAPPDEIKVVKTKPPELESFISENEEYDDVEEDLDYSEKKRLLSRVDDVIQADDVIMSDGVTKNNFQNV